MSSFLELKNQINLLGRAEYRYDRLVSDFAEHYLELKRSDYKTLPEIQTLKLWLAHLNHGIRPTLVTAWRKVAEKSGFCLGDLIEIDEVKLYAIKADSYPDLAYVRFTGFSAKKDLSPGRSTVSVKIEDGVQVKNYEKSLEDSVIEPLFFEGSSRMKNVKEFLKDELAQLA